MTPVFGDFLTQAGDHVSAAASDLSVLPDDVRLGLTRALDRLLGVLISHLSDIIPAAEYGHDVRELTADTRAVLAVPGHLR